MASWNARAVNFWYIINMEEIKKMLRAVINGQSAMRQEMLSKISGLNVKVEGLDKKIDGVEMRLTKRIDKLGKQIAYVEDDAPTREEFDGLEKRVQKVESKMASA